MINKRKVNKELVNASPLHIMQLYGYLPFDKLLTYYDGDNKVIHRLYLWVTFVCLAL